MSCSRFPQHLGDSVVVAGLRDERCRIVAVQKLDALELAKLLPQKGTPVSVKATIQYPEEKSEADAEADASDDQDAIEATP